MSIPTMSFENMSCLEYKELATKRLILSVSLLCSIFFVNTVTQVFNVFVENGVIHELVIVAFLLNSVFIRMYGST